MATKTEYQWISHKTMKFTERSKAFRHMNLPRLPVEIVTKIFELATCTVVEKQLNRFEGYLLKCYIRDSILLTISRVCRVGRDCTMDSRMVLKSLFLVQEQEDVAFAKFARNS